MVDYKIGDWVETCQMMPGIVQDIDKDHDNVIIFYPHYKDKSPDYTGGSCCSIKHCGVHKISEEQAYMMLSIGEERLTRIWEFLKRDAKINSIEKRIEWYQKEFINYYENMPIKERKMQTSAYWCREERGLCGIKLYNVQLEYYKNYVEKLKTDDLCKAWDLHKELYKQTISNIYNGIINHTTQGIWLSYKKINVEKLTGNERIITIETGEKFLTIKENGKYKLIEKLN